MQKPQPSFLFLCLLLFLFPIILFGQYQVDSTSYHYGHILNPQHSSDIPDAIQYYTLLKEKHLKTKNIPEAIKDYRMLAIAQFEIGNIFDSESNTVAALTLIDNSSSSPILVSAKTGLYNQLGRIYRSTDRYEDAVKAYSKALQFTTKQKDSLVILNNIGNLYKDMGNYARALKEFELGLSKKNIQKNVLAYAMLLDNKGSAQAKIDNPEALINLEHALALRKQENDTPGQYSSYRNLALFYFNKNDSIKALDYANRAYEVAKTMNSLSYLENALSIFIKMSPDPKIVRFERITDSIEKEKQLAENKNAFMKYNVENERKNTVAAQLENEKQKTWKILILAIAIIGFVLAIVLYFNLKFRHKQEKVKQVYTTEKRISKKVHDEVANDVYRLMAKLQSKPPEKEEVLDDLESIYNKSRDISKENSTIDVENFHETLSDLLLSYENKQLSVIRREGNPIDWSGVSEVKKTNLYRVLQELMTNMAKHSEATAVVLNMDQKNKKILIKYADNGKGVMLKNKNGLQNAESRIAAINGSITFESEPTKGFKATITI